MTTESIPFGQDPAGRMVDATEVPSGLACRCICPACKAPLIARKGEVRKPHFAHQADQSRCTTALESSVHRMAKQLYTEMHLIRLPGMEISVTGDVALNEQHTIRRTVPLSGGVFRFTSVEVEKSHGHVRPDVVLHGGTDLMVEVLVTHAVDEKKASLLREGNFACVEVDLGTIDRLTDRAGLTQALQGPSFYKWIHHPGAPQALAELNERLEKELPGLRARWQARMESQRRQEELDARRKAESKAQRERRRAERDSEQSKLSRFAQRERGAEEARRSKSFDELYVRQSPGLNINMQRAMLAVQEAVLRNPDALLDNVDFNRLCRDLRWELHVPGDGASKLVLEYLGASTPQEGYARLLEGQVPKIVDAREVVCTNCGGLQLVPLGWGRGGREIYACQHCGEYFDAGARP